MTVPHAIRKGFLAARLAGCSALATFCLADTTIRPTNCLAYGANIGWVNFAGDVTHGATIERFVCSENLYAAHVGWISLGSGNPTNGYEYSNTTASDFGVNHDGLGNLRGLAYGANVAWVAFEPMGALRVDLHTGILSGYLYGANVGWISLSNATAQIRITELTDGLDSDGDGIPDMREMLRTGSLTNLTASGDRDADGQSDADEYVSDTDPLAAESRLAITHFALPAPDLGILSWLSTPTRHYRIVQAKALTNAAGWSDCGLGFIEADAGETTPQALTGIVGTSRSYRVHAYVPLSP